MKLNAKQLRKTKPSQTDLKDIKRNPIYFVLDEIYDTYNIGSIFRLADAVTAKKVYLCGDMEYPPSSRIHKAAVGTEEWVPWEKTDSTFETVKDLKNKGVQIIAVEQSSKSIDVKKLKPNFPCAIVVGNETTGVSKEVLKVSGKVVELPMYGVNKSFNVWGSLAVVAYKIIEHLDRQELP
ncbi:TrmH family RNA methyltransferase [Patescibacteria group bacterium]